MTKYLKDWKLNTATVRGAIIGGIFVLLAGVCTLCAAVVTISPGIVTTITNSFSPSIEVGKIYFQQDDFIFTPYENTELTLIPLNCIAPTTNFGIVKFSPKDYGSVFLRILLLSDQNAVISDVVLKVDEFSSPPILESVENGGIRQSNGQGGGKVADFILPNVAVNSSFTSKSVVEGNAYYFDDQDALIFALPIMFSEPGLYTFHLEFVVKKMIGDSYTVVTGPLNYGWIYWDDFSSPFTVYNGTITEFTDCP